MEAMREAWTDERLDDLNHRVDEGFREMRVEFRAVRAEMSAQNRMTVQLFGGMFATMVVGFLGTIATILVRG
ncbi:MAG: hypothetical protein H0X42_11000 [Solirubrobacterales bacterium]|nr:hypothetical protein [Solirubrobacterales bacterium]